MASGRPNHRTRPAEWDWVAGVNLLGPAYGVSTFVPLMLEHLGYPEAAKDVVRAIEQVIIQGPHTPDMKGKASTSEIGAAVADAVRGQSKKAD